MEPATDCSPTGCRPCCEPLTSVLDNGRSTLWGRAADLDATRTPRHTVDRREDHAEPTRQVTIGQRNGLPEGTETSAVHLGDGLR